MEEFYRDYKIKIVQDEYPMNPRRDFDSFGNMICFHSRYCLGDINHGISKEELCAIVKRKDVIALPLYILDHSGLWMKTGNRNFGTSWDGWDTSFVGYIYATYKMIRDEYHVSRVTRKVIKRAISLMESEVETYSQYLSGEVYAWLVEDPFGDHVDSCSGYFGCKSTEEMVCEARILIDHEINLRLSEANSIHFEEIGCTI